MTDVEYIGCGEIPLWFAALTTTIAITLLISTTSICCLTCYKFAAFPVTIEFVPSLQDSASLDSKNGNTRTPTMTPSQPKLSPNLCNSRQIRVATSFGLHASRRSVRTEDDKIGIKTSYKVLCLVSLFIFSFVHGSITLIEIIVFESCPSKATESLLYQICVKFMQYTYFLPLALSYVLFMLRIKGIFKDSIIELSVCQTRMFYFLSFALMTIFPIGDLFGTVLFGFGSFGQVSPPMSFYVTLGVWIVTYVISFIYTLVILSRQLKFCQTKIFYNDEAKRAKLFHFSTKLLVCVFIAMSSTLVTGSSYGVVKNIDEKGTYGILVIYLLNSIDFLTNCICLIMQWSKFDSIYVKYCFICDNCVKKFYKYSKKRQFSVDSVAGASVASVSPKIVITSIDKVKFSSTPETVSVTITPNIDRVQVTLAASSLDRESSKASNDTQE